MAGHSFKVPSGNTLSIWLHCYLVLVTCITAVPKANMTQPLFQLAWTVLQSNNMDIVRTFHTKSLDTATRLSLLQSGPPAALRLWRAVADFRWRIILKYFLLDLFFLSFWQEVPIYWWGDSPVFPASRKPCQFPKSSNVTLLMSRHHVSCHLNTALLIILCMPDH